MMSLATDRVASCRLRCVILTAALFAWQALTASATLAQRQLFEPEATTTRTEGSLARAKTFMVTTSSRPASEAGLEMLRAGGSAVDAAIAAQLVLGLVEPQSSGLGGGAFLIHWDKAAKSLVAYDGRETAPAAAKPDRFLKDGAPLPFEMAVRSGLSIGTPGLVRLLKATHEKHGKLPWARLFEPAIRLADDGFTVTQRLHLLLRLTGIQAFGETARAYFFDKDGAPRCGGSHCQKCGLCGDAAGDRGEGAGWILRGRRGGRDSERGGRCAEFCRRSDGR